MNSVLVDLLPFVSTQKTCGWNHTVAFLSVEAALRSGAGGAKTERLAMYAKEAPWMSLNILLKFGDFLRMIAFMRAFESSQRTL